MEQLVLNTGRVACQFYFKDRDETGTIYFNPTDLDFAARMYALKDKTAALVQNMDDIELNPDGTPVAESMFESYAKVVEAIKAELDAAFDSEVSAVLFKHASPFTTIEGEYFIEQIMRVLVPFVTAKYEAERKALEKRKKDMDGIKKHVGKYTEQA